jgi:CBS domain-containing protein
MRNAATASQPIQRIFSRRGAPVEHAFACADADPDPARARTIADQVPVTQIMSRETTCARRDVEVSQLVELMVQCRTGCIPVIEAPGRPVGMVTKLDLVERLFADEAAGGLPGPLPVTAGDLMMPLAITLGDHATVAHAAALMASENVHHVAIVDGEGRLVGLVSTMDVVRWLARNDGFGGL